MDIEFVICFLAVNIAIELFCMVITDDFGVLNKVINKGHGWETPREPYEVKAWISTKSGDGKLILSHTEGEPYFFTLGKSEVPKGLEMGIGTMAREGSQSISGSLQSLCWGSSIIGGILSSYFSGSLVHAYGFRWLSVLYFQILSNFVADIVGCRFRIFN